jgi:hypothetical protein
MNETPTIDVLGSDSKAAQWEQLATEYKTLLHDSKFVEATSAMITARRMYSVAYREMLGLIGVAGGEDPSPAAIQVADFAAQYAMFRAGKPFSEHELMRALIDVVLPWLTEVVDSHTESDENQLAAEEAERRRAPVPLPFPHTIFKDATAGHELDRKQSLVLVGVRPAVRYLLDRILASFDESPQYVIVLRDHTDDDLSSHRLVFPKAVWKDFGVNDRAVLKFLSVALPLFSRPLDVLVCDDLAAAGGGGFTWRTPAAKAGDAHRNIRKMCNAHGAGFIAGTFVSAENSTEHVPDISGPDYEQLRTFATLRPVGYRKDGDEYILTVGDAYETRVPDAEMVPYINYEK